MAFNKNPLQDGVKTKLKDYSVDLENRIGDIGKADIGLGNVLNQKQTYILNDNYSDTGFEYTFPDNGLFLVAIGGNLNSARGLFFVGVWQSGVQVNTVSNHTNITNTVSGRKITFSFTGWSHYSIIRLN